MSYLQGAVGKPRNAEGTTRRDRNRQAIKEKIIRSAEAVFANHGYRGATTMLIAERAGIPKANLHYYFPTKRQLYEAVIQRILLLWLEASNSFDFFEDPERALRSYIDTKLELARAEPLASRLFAMEVIQGAHHIGDHLRTTLVPWFEARIQRIAEWVRAGRIRRCEPANLLFQIWAQTQHYADFSVQIEILNRGKPLTHDQWLQAKRDCIETLMRGYGLSSNDSA